MPAPQLLQNFDDASFSVPQLALFTAEMAPAALPLPFDACAEGGGTSSSSLLTSLRNSLMPLPSEPPRSASRVAPNSMTRTSKMMTSSMGPSPNGPAAAIGSTSCTLVSTFKRSIGIAPPSKNGEFTVYGLQLDAR